MPKMLLRIPQILKLTVPKVLNFSEDPFSKYQRIKAMSSEPKGNGPQSEDHMHLSADGRH